MALAVASVSGLAASAQQDRQAQMRAASGWLATPWSETREKALEAGKPAVDPAALVRLPGSKQVYSRKQLSNTVADWWPQDHPPLPAIVAKGIGKAMPCAECHGPSGAGSAHTATLTGLPAAYIRAQVKAFRDGSRANDEMLFEASNVSDAEVQEAATYFSGLHLAQARAGIMEASRVPKTHVESWMLVPTEGGGSEPIGDRVIELPVSVERARMGDEHTRVVGYVPPGSLARGRLLASTGAGVTAACASCHGADLRGLANVPPLAGRSPTYLTRQLVQFALGRRRGDATLPMQQEVAKLSLKDMIAVAAYAASLKP